MEAFSTKVYNAHVVNVTERAGDQLSITISTAGCCHHGPEAPWPWVAQWCCLLSPAAHCLPAQKALRRSEEIILIKIILFYNHLYALIGSLYLRKVKSGVQEVKWQRGVLIAVLLKKKTALNLNERSKQKSSEYFMFPCD